MEGIAIPIGMMYLQTYLILLITIYSNSSKRRRIIRKNRIIRKKKGQTRMNELINKYIGKECIIFIQGSVSGITGDITAVNDNWITVKTKDGDETVNLDYIVRIKEYPKKSNGKKKSIVF